MNGGVIRAFGGEPAQQGLGVAQTAGLHVDVGEADRGFGALRINGVGIKCQNLFVFRFGVRKFLLPFMQQTRGKVRFGILRRELGSLAVSLERVLRLLAFQQMRKREPGAGLTFFSVSPWVLEWWQRGEIARPRGYWRGRASGRG